MDAKDSAKPIDLKGANFDELLSKSNLYVGPAAPQRLGLLSFAPRARCRPPTWPDGRAASRPVSHLAARPDFPAAAREWRSCDAAD